MSARQLLHHWVDAERTGDQGAFADLLTDDFTGIGPHGFVLTAEEWVRRFDEPFEVGELHLDEMDERAIDDSTMLVTALQHQVASYRGHSSDGTYRVSFLVRRDARGWRVSHAQLSGPLPAPPPGASPKTPA